jgi:cell division protein FtsL
MKIIEVLLSILFIFLFLSTISSIEIKNYNRIKIQVFYALKSLDYNNELRNLIFSNDTEKLEKRLKEILQLNYDYKVLINFYLNL